MTPTEPGWYWARFRNGGEGLPEWVDGWEAVEVCVAVTSRRHQSPERDRLFMTCSGRDETWRLDDDGLADSGVVKWGPRIPEPEKLQEMLELDADGKEFNRDHG